MDASFAAAEQEDCVGGAPPTAAARPRALLTSSAHPLTAISAPLLDQWSELAENASEPNPFAEPWFVAAGLRAFARGEVRLVEVREAGTLIGLLPLCVARGYARLPVRHVCNWSHYHDFLGTPLVRRGREQDFWTETLDLLDKADWASGLLHLTNVAEGGPIHSGLRSAAAAIGRPCDIVHRSIRAELRSDLSPDAYYELNVRKKKRKELKRLQNRLAELGPVTLDTLADDGDVDSWCEDYLTLERSGWKGRAGSALGSDPTTARFLRETLRGAQAARRLELLRLSVGGWTIAMMINFLTPPGAYSFKIAFDEEYARFSPGVLIQLENLRILARADVAWMDSCAAENHPMIDSLWAERRAIVRLSVPLSGLKRSATFHLCRALEKASARLREASSPSRPSGAQ